MRDYGELIGRVAGELRRLAQCGDIPAYRRKQLLAAAEDLDPSVRPAGRADTEPFVDPYYRRPGMRLRLEPTEPGEGTPYPPNPLLLLSALSHVDVAREE
jgi:hypothetical protein